MGRLGDEDRKLFEKQLRTERHRIGRAENAIRLRKREEDRMALEHQDRLRAVMARESTARIEAPKKEEPAPSIALDVHEDGTVHLKPDDLAKVVSDQVAREMEGRLEPRRQAEDAQQVRQQHIADGFQRAELNETAQQALGEAYQMFRAGADQALRSVLNRAPTAEDIGQLNMDQLVDLMRRYGVEEEIKSKYPDLDLQDMADMEMAWGRPEMRRLATPVFDKIKRLYSGKPNGDPAKDPKTADPKIDPDIAARKPRSQSARGELAVTTGNAGEGLLALSAEQITNLTAEEWTEYKRRLRAEGHEHL